MQIVTGAGYWLGWLSGPALIVLAVWLLYRWLRQDQTLNPGDPVEAQRDRERNNGY